MIIWSFQSRSPAGQRSRIPGPWQAQAGEDIASNLQIERRRISPRRRHEPLPPLMFNRRPVEPRISSDRSVTLYARLLPRGSLSISGLPVPPSCSGLPPSSRGDETPSKFRDVLSLGVGTDRGSPIVRRAATLHQCFRSSVLKSRVLQYCRTTRAVRACFVSWANLRAECRYIQRSPTLGLAWCGRGGQQHAVADDVPAATCCRCRSACDRR